MVNDLNFQNWDEFFNKNPFTFFMTSQIQKKYIQTINSYTPENGTLLEIAGGSGYTSAVVADLVRTKNASVIFSDLEKSLTEKVAMNFDSVVNLNFKAVDAFNIPFKNGEFDIIYHQGFLEHFNDNDIIRLLKEQARVAKYVIFDVPNSRRWDKTQEFGNERFLSHSKWKSLVKAAGLHIQYDTARRFNNIWKQLVPVIVQNSELFHKFFGESSIIVCRNEET